jgi:mono/diheme cytochrome c family protein
MSPASFRSFGRCCCFSVLLWGAATTAQTQNERVANDRVANDRVTNVPDAITRTTGLKLEPMPRAARTYATNCQGCHGAEGVSVTEIPSLAGRIGYFARIPEGRRYLVQVPNVALNPSSDADIAEMMNWLLDTYSRAQLPNDFQPYTAQEVALLRQTRIDPAANRRRVVAQLVASKQVPSPEVLAIPHASLY